MRVAAMRRVGRFQRAAVLCLQRRTVRGRPVGVDGPSGWRRALCSDVQRKPCGWTCNTGGANRSAAGTQGSRRNALSARQSGHVHQRKVPGECNTESFVLFWLVSNLACHIKGKAISDKRYLCEVISAEYSRLGHQIVSCENGGERSVPTLCFGNMPF
jgi:hypothetical protein